MSELRHIVDQLQQHPTSRYGRRDIATIRRIIVHHSLTAGGDAFGFARYHVGSNGWPGIGYHEVITPDGTVYQTQLPTTVSYHCSGYNLSSYGICLVGNFDVGRPTENQLAALLQRLATLRADWGPLPVEPHSQYSTKSCPGRKFPFAELLSRLDGLENPPGPDPAPIAPPDTIPPALLPPQAEAPAPVPETRQGCLPQWLATRPR